MKAQTENARNDLNGRTALVTGASRGIGKAIAMDLSRSGARLVLVARTENLLASVAKDIEKMGGKASVHTLDLSMESACDALLEQLSRDDISVDILVNNAGMYATDQIDARSAPQRKAAQAALWRKTLSLNLTAPFLLSQGLAPQMVERHWGRIVNISSISGKKAEAFGSAYSSSKFGLIGMTQAMALELARHAVTVNAVCPGWVDTELAREQINDPQWCQLNDIPLSESEEIARLSVPQMRFIEPDEVASLVSYLCSDRAKGITGQAINICGGLSIT